MAEFDDKPFSSSSMCVCVCATNSTNIPVTKIGSKEAPESCEVHEHHILASLQIRVPFLSPPIELLQLVENPQISLLFFFKTQIPGFGSNSQTTIKQVRAQQHHKKSPSTNSISYNFFNQFHFIQFLQLTECHRISSKHNFFNQLKSTILHFL
jgi:hypothetical protein